MSKIAGSFQVTVLKHTHKHAHKNGTKHTHSHLHRRSRPGGGVMKVNAGAVHTHKH